MIIPEMQPLEDLGETMDVYFPRGQRYEFGPKKCLGSQGQWFAVKVHSLDNMLIYAREGACTPLAEPGRLRTFNETGKVVKIERLASLLLRCSAIVGGTSTVPDCYIEDIVGYSC